MPLPSIDTLKNNVLHAEQEATEARLAFGEDSAEYRQALKQFAVSWFVLKKTREPEEFLAEITA